MRGESVEHFAGDRSLLVRVAIERVQGDVQPDLRRANMRGDLLALQRFDGGDDLLCGSRGLDAKAFRERAEGLDLRRAERVRVGAFFGEWPEDPEELVVA